eukprot:SAG31_NODE_2600_length_5414_cov_3.077140_8_plen_59_part_00
MGLREGTLFHRYTATKFSIWVLNFRNKFTSKFIKNSTGILAPWRVFFKKTNGPMRYGT